MSTVNVIDQDICDYGLVLALLGPQKERYGSDIFEAWISKIRRETNLRIDWHFAGQMFEEYVVVKALGSAQELDVLRDKLKASLSEINANLAAFYDDFNKTQSQYSHLSLLPLIWTPYEIDERKRVNVHAGRIEAYTPLEQAIHAASGGQFVQAAHIALSSSRRDSKVKGGYLWELGQYYESIQNKTFALECYKSLPREDEHYQAAMNRMGALNTPVVVAQPSSFFQPQSSTGIAAAIMAMEP